MIYFERTWPVRITLSRKGNWGKAFCLHLRSWEGGEFQNGICSWTIFTCEGGFPSNLFSRHAQVKLNSHSSHGFEFAAIISPSESSNWSPPLWNFSFHSCHKTVPHCWVFWPNNGKCLVLRCSGWPRTEAGWSFTLYLHWKYQDNNLQCISNTKTQALN